MDECLSPDSPDGKHCHSCVEKDLGYCHFSGCEFLWEKKEMSD